MHPANFSHPSLQLTLICREVLTHHARICIPTHEAYNSCHQDRYWVKEPNSYTLWSALHDSERDRGGLTLISGSQKWGLQPHHTCGSVLGSIVAKNLPVPPTPLDWLSADFRVGDAVIFGDLVVHTGIRPQSNKGMTQARVNIDLRFRIATA